jgi:predicted AAA+ superfamily ATPase
MMHELRKARIVASGSNRELLSCELGTKLTGRHLDMAVYPLSFAEFIRFRSGGDEKVYLRSYLEQGGFPAPVLEARTAGETLIGYFRDILERDVVERYRVRNKEKLVELARFVAGNFSSRMTYGSIGRFLSLKPEVVRQYVGFLQEAFLVFLVGRVSDKPKLVEVSPRKVYCVDTGMARELAIGGEVNFRRLAENAVFLELMRRMKPVSYWKDDLHREVDFVVGEAGGREVYQICWNIQDVNTKEREVKSLVLGLADLGLKEGTILTEDYEANEVSGGKVIKYRKLWEWLYENRD